jgi:hypothetical protein
MRKMTLLGLRLNTILIERLRPTLVFSRLNLGANALEMGLAIDHPNQPARTHIMLQLVVLAIFQHGFDRVVVEQNFS